MHVMRRRLSASRAILMWVNAVLVARAEDDYAATSRLVSAGLKFIYRLFYLVLDFALDLLAVSLRLLKMAFVFQLAIIGGFA